MKADADRDLYKDLELEPSADANEIKKQFKKLGMGSILCLLTIWLIDIFSQLSNTILIATPAKKWSTTPSSKQYNLRTRCSPIRNSVQNMMHSVYEQGCSTPTTPPLHHPQNLTCLHGRLQTASHHPHVHHQPLRRSLHTSPRHQALRNMRDSIDRNQHLLGLARAPTVRRRRQMITRHGSR